MNNIELDEVEDFLAWINNKVDEYNIFKENNLRNCNCIRLCISGVPEEHMDALATIISVIRS